MGYTHVDYNQLDDPLPFKILYANHYTNFKTSTILDMILNGKGSSNLVYMGSVMWTC